MPSYDTIIIGGGTNGLACAGRLARAGQRVIVLEAAETVGGGGISHEFAPGYRVSGLAHILNMLDPRVEAEMNLAAHGLGMAATNLASTALSADGHHLRLDGIAGETLTGDLTEDEHRAWAALRGRLMQFAGALAPFRSMAPPRIAKGAGNPYLKLAKLGLDLRRMGREEFRAFLRMILINVADVLEDELTDQRLMGLVAFDTVLGAWMGPRSPNSLILYLNRLAGEVSGQRGALCLPRGGMGAVADAMASSLRASGAEIRTGARVARVTVEGDRASGVEMEDGEVITASRVVSAISPAATFLNLVGPAHLDTGFLRRIRAFRSRGGAAKLHLALTGCPDFRGADPATRLVIAPGVRAVEDAFNAVKYGEVPAAPVMEITLPSVSDPTMAPKGHHVLSAIVQFAPHAPKAGHDAARAEMLENTLTVLEAHAPGLRGLIAHAELLMPYDIEDRFGMAGGNWHHGELAVEQMLFLRPVIGAAQYQSPLPGLWLASAGAHPGGGISGAAGWNAAERMIREDRA